MRKIKTHQIGATCAVITKVADQEKNKTGKISFKKTAV